MADNTDTNEVEVAGSSESASSQLNGSGPRMRTPAVVAALYAAAFLYSFQAPDLIQNLIGFMLAPVLSVIILSVWWLRSKGVPSRDRTIGFGIFLLGAVILAVGAMPILVVAAPVALIGVVVVLLVTSGRAWPLRRALAAGYLIACVCFFSLFHVDDVGGNFIPLVSWRWDPSLGELTLAEDASGTADLPAQAGPSDWPEFRGIARDNVLAGVTFATDWADTPPRELWRTRVGLGWSSFTVVGDYFFTQEQRGGDEVVVCYDANSGEPVWANTLSGRFNDATGDGPRATPTFHEGELYALSATGLLQRLDPASGQTLWKRDLKKDTGAKIPRWGFSSSPLITGDLVVVVSGGPDGKGVAAYARDSGDLRWTSGDGTHTYSSAQIAQIGDVPQLLIISDIGIQAHAPDTGELLWEHRWSITSNPRCVQPLVVDSSIVLIGTAGGQGTRRLDVEWTDGAWSVTEGWTTRRFRPYFNDFVYYDGYCYGYDGKRLTCIDVATGERVWTGGNHGGQVLLLPDMKMLLLLSEKGEILLLEVTPDGEKVIEKLKVLKGKTWNHPVIANGKLFVRNAHEMACFQLPA